MALSIAVIVFGLTVGALYFLIKQWRVKELARRKRRALLAAGLGAREDDEEGASLSTNDNTTDTTLPSDSSLDGRAPRVASEEPAAVLAFHEEASTRLSTSLRRLMQAVLDQERAYEASYQSLVNSHYLWRSNKEIAARDAYFHEHGSANGFTNAVSNRLKAEAKVIEAERAIVDGLKNMLSTKTISNAVAALARELKALASYKATQLTPQLASFRLIAQVMTSGFPERIKRHYNDKLEVRKKTKSIKVGDFKTSPFPLTADQDELIARATRLLGEFYEARTRLAEVVLRAENASKAYQSCLSDTLQMRPSNGTRIAFDRCFDSNEKSILLDRQAQKALHQAVGDLPPLMTKVETCADELLALIAKVKEASNASQKLLVVRGFLTAWELEILSHRKEARSKGPKVELSDTASATTSDPALAAAIEPQLSQLKDRLAQIQALLFDIQSSPLEHRAYEHKCILSESRTLTCPEKPNDAEVGQLLVKLDQWSRRALMAHRERYRELGIATAHLDQCTAEVGAATRLLEPLLKLLSQPLDENSRARIQTAKLFHDFLAGRKLSAVKEELSAEPTIPPPVSGEVPVDSQTANRLIEDLRAGARSVGFAAAQSAVALAKQDAARDLRNPNYPRQPGEISLQLTEIDVLARVAELEEHFVETDACDRRQAEIGVARIAAKTAYSTRMGKTSEKSDALKKSVQKAEALLRADPGEDLYLANQAATKMAELFVPNNVPGK